MLNKYLKVDYTDKIHETLILPSFWELKEPCDWKAIAYLSDLCEKDPVLTKRVLHNCLLKDANLKKLIVPGTIAEAMLKGNTTCTKKFTRK